MRREEEEISPAEDLMREHDALGEEFEDEERRLLGEDGFEGVVSQVAEIERKLGIGDLAQFTPVL